MTYPIIFEIYLATFMEKKHFIKKFRESNMGINSFTAFYSELIRLVFDLKYNLKILIDKFKYKLML